MLTWHTQELEEVRAAHAEVQGELGVLQQEGDDAKRMHSKELQEVRAALADVHGEVTMLQQEVEDGARLHSEARALQNELEMQVQGAQSTISALGKVCMCVCACVCVHVCAI